MNIFDCKTDDYLIKTDNNTPYSVNSFSNYIKRITSKYLKMGLNPHIFRNIVPTYYYSQTKNNTYASLYLMHKPKDFTDTDLVNIDFDYNDVVKDVNQVLVKLCKSNCRRNKTEKNIDNNVIQFKK